jgi:hypothetical protein
VEASRRHPYPVAHAKNAARKTFLVEFEMALGCMLRLAPLHTICYTT